MIEPDGVQRAARIERRRLPAAIAERALGLKIHLVDEGAAAVARARGPDLRRAVLRVPRHRDHRIGHAGSRHQRDARRDLAADARVARDRVDAHRRREGAAAVAADRQEDVALAVRGRAPGHRDERAGRGDPRCAVGASGTASVVPVCAAAVSRAADQQNDRSDEQSSVVIGDLFNRSSI